MAVWRDGRLRLRLEFESVSTGSGRARVGCPMLAAPIGEGPSPT
jgi:hypothetical protein